MTPRLRRLLIAASALALAVLLGMAGSVYLLLRPGRITAMLQDQARQAGLVLRLDSPASPTVFPRPALELHGITLNAEGANAPILWAARGRLALPWRTLFGGPAAISRMEIDAPRLDLDALQNWLAARPSQPADSTPMIPRIDTGISITQGSVTLGNQLLLDNVTLSAGALSPDHPFPLNMSATAAGAPWQAQLTVTPHMQGATLRLDDIQLHLSQGNRTTLALHGTARWHGGANADAQLDGKLDQANAGSSGITLTLVPADQTNPLLLHLKLDGTGNHADMSLPPLALAHWWSALTAPGDTQTASQPALPPANGSLQMNQLQIGSIGITGLSVQTRGNTAPAPASSTAGKPDNGGTSK